jgi:hypothetical protein
MLFSISVVTSLKRSFFFEEVLEYIHALRYVTILIENSIQYSIGVTVLCFALRNGVM